MVDPLVRQPPNLVDHLQSLLRQVPTGRVTTYGRLARALGNVAASRWVGTWALAHPHTPDCRCHRLVRADGTIGEYWSRDSAEKAALLASEGVAVTDGRVDLAVFEQVGLRPAQPAPLAALAELQRTLGEQVVTLNPQDEPQEPLRRIAGVDVSYVGPEDGVATYALCDAATGELLGETTIRRPVRFPYITSYLSFRELPLLLDLLDEAGRREPLADVVVVDGSGILHPRGAGIASHLGVTANLPTIGLTKKLLCGAVDIKALRPGESLPVLLDERHVGSALLPRTGTARPVFVSPGHRTSVLQATRLISHQLRQRRLPEPIYWADRLSRQAAKRLQS